MFKSLLISSTLLLTLSGCSALLGMLPLGKGVSLDGQIGDKVATTTVGSNQSSDGNEGRISRDSTEINQPESVSIHNTVDDVSWIERAFWMAFVMLLAFRPFKNMFNRFRAYRKSKRTITKVRQL